MGVTAQYLVDYVEPPIVEEEEKWEEPWPLDE